MATLHGFCQNASNCKRSVPDFHFKSLIKIPILLWYFAHDEIFVSEGGGGAHSETFGIWHPLQTHITAHTAITVCCSISQFRSSTQLNLMLYIIYLWYYRGTSYKMIIKPHLPIKLNKPLKISQWPFCDFWIKKCQKDRPEYSCRCYEIIKTDFRILLVGLKTDSLNNLILWVGDISSQSWDRPCIYPVMFWVTSVSRLTHMYLSRV